MIPTLNLHGNSQQSECTSDTDLVEDQVEGISSILFKNLVTSYCQLPSINMIDMTISFFIKFDYF
jgi:hypothetical protein